MKRLLQHLPASGIPFLAVPLIASTAFALWPQTPPLNLPRARPSPYPLSTCIVSGEKVNSRGKASVYYYKGMEFRFCCDSCPKTFLRNPSKYLAKLKETLDGTVF